ncbi:MAG TPA: hypothetical protein DDZ90_03200 [Planctomycetaceae bacterium]|nr:hypothetical protein [Planctomycetaceae bacterium]
MTGSSIFLFFFQFFDGLFHFLAGLFDLFPSRRLLLLLFLGLLVFSLLGFSLLALLLLLLRLLLLFLRLLIRFLSFRPFLIGI